MPNSLPLNTRNILPLQTKPCLERCNGGVKKLGRHESHLVPSELSVAGKLPVNGIAAGDTPGSDAYLCNIKILEKVQNTETARFVI